MKSHKKRKIKLYINNRSKPIIFRVPEKDAEKLIEAYSDYIKTGTQEALSGFHYFIPYSSISFIKISGK